MKKVIFIILGVVVAGILGVLGIAATKPDAMHVERSTNIDSTPENILSHIDNFHHWAAWSPWEKMDPNMKRSFSGPESGKGAIYAWVGNNDVGEGDMEILESSPSKVEIKLHFLKPFEDTSKATFTMEPQGEKSTKVTWAMDGKSPFMCKVMQVFMNFDEMMGKDFDKGLAALKNASENTGKGESGS